MSGSLINVLGFLRFDLLHYARNAIFSLRLSVPLTLTSDTCKRKPGNPSLIYRNTVLTRTIHQSREICFRRFLDQALINR